MHANRPFIDKANPEIYKAAVTAAQTTRKAAVAAGLDVALIELVNSRVSQMNRCHTCLSIHVPAARKAGVDQLKLDILSAWRHAEIFSDVERSALLLAESLTDLSVPVDHEAVAAEVGQHLSTEQISAIEWVVTLINAFNRISIASNHPTVGGKQLAAMLAAGGGAPPSSGGSAAASGGGSTSGGSAGTRAAEG
ncbi:MULTISPECIES: carboxymuconolactone decarboxylase family protein [unclassified Brevibacterium]|uniref:carboxymuconolactone decarboxylase family protein n=1 Tax=unclassified Brevibacterium TaxID=2614124 RepID=UPI0010F7D45D|nr:MULTISPECIES: carboxymuconolactone decarboxylase family protein [unclassified Brevibacterium]MCM1013058.1 carboxymuconolactone decarboxylase family protein [Brevibacterium sp. XM4083]